MPIPFSSIAGVAKPPREHLEKARKDGVVFDLDAEQKPPVVGMETLADVDIEAEKLKSAECPY